MAKKTKTYPLYIALLLCFFQVAGIDVYAQEPVKVSQDSISPVREAPKARARRHREPVVSTPATDSVKVEKAVVLPPIDSLENLKPAIVTADSLEEVNRQNLERIETPVMPSVVKADSLPPVMPKKLFVPNPTKLPGMPSYFRAEDKFITANTGSYLLYMVDLPDVLTH